MPESKRSDTIASISLSNQAEVFLPTLESLQDLLARRLVQDCHAITDHDLNYTILSSILQVLFLRTGQDCGFVEPGTLALLAGSEGISRRMARSCSDAGLSPDILFEKGPDGPNPLPAVPDDDASRSYPINGFGEISRAHVHTPNWAPCCSLRTLIGDKDSYHRGIPRNACRKVCGALYRKR